MNIFDIILCVVVVLFVVICIASLIFCNRTFVVRRYKYISRKVNQPFKLIFISDLHNKIYPDGNVGIYDVVKEMAPDIIVIGGDMTVAKPAIHKAMAGDLSGMDEALRFLKELPAIAPTYFVNGNHEQRIYETGCKSGDPKFENVRKVIDHFYAELDKMGIHQLHNEVTDLHDGIRLYGYEHACEHYEKLLPNPIPEGDLTEKLGKPDSQYCNILIAHNPKFYETYAKWGANLVLAGHVHGGLMRFGRLGLIGPDLHPFPKYSGGAYTYGTSEMIVTCGLGAHTLPIRIFNPGEISMVEIRPGKH